MFKTIHRTALGLGVSMAVLSGVAWGGDVTVYEKAPSVEELQLQLQGGGAKKKLPLKTRAIYMDTAPAQQEAPVAGVPTTNMPTTNMPAAEPSAAPPTRQVAAGSEGVAIAFPIQFQINKAVILPESTPFLEAIAGLMQKDADMRLMIEGHTDKSGNALRNTALSRERAFSVMNYLIDHYGIAPMRLVPVGKGSSEPLPGLDPGSSKNRRVQFRVAG